MTLDIAQMDQGAVEHCPDLSDRPCTSINSTNTVLILSKGSIIAASGLVML